eukprot:scaffold1144_cov37-Phaeocystis_antarctica.AAC.3
MQSRCSISSTIASRPLPSLDPPRLTCRWTTTPAKQPGCQRHARGTLWQYQERQQSHTTPDWARRHNGHGTMVTSKPYGRFAARTTDVPVIHPPWGVMKGGLQRTRRCTALEGPSWLSGQPSTPFGGRLQRTRRCTALEGPSWLSGQLSTP